MKTWCGSDVDPSGRWLSLIGGWIRCIVQPWFWPEWYRIWKRNTQ